MSEVNTWITPCGEWKAQAVGPICKGKTREVAMKEAVNGAIETFGVKAIKPGDSSISPKCPTLGAALKNMYRAAIDPSFVQEWIKELGEIKAAHEANDSLKAQPRQVVTNANGMKLRVCVSDACPTGDAWFVNDSGMIVGRITNIGGVEFHSNIKKDLESEGC